MTMETTTAIQDVIQYGIDQMDNIVEGIEGADLHNALYNEDYFIIGYYNAEKFLDKYGSFSAIGDIQQYEKDQFGDVTTDLSDSEKVANMFAYIKGEEALSECKTLQDNWDNKLTADMIASIKAELEAQL